MRSKKSLVWVAGGAVFIASLVIAGGAVASTVLILNPAEMTGKLSFSAETLTSATVRASSSDGLEAWESVTTSPYSLTVESGHNYNPGVEAYFSNPTAESTSLRISRSASVFIDNASGPTTVDWQYPSTRRLNFTISVTGGTISRYFVYASAGAGAESYFARTYQHLASPRPSSVTSWNVMVPRDGVSVYGSVDLVAADGTTQVTRPLGMQTVNLQAEPASVIWPIDLTSTGTLEGLIAVTPGGGINSQILYFRGVNNTPTQGTNGWLQVPPDGHYTLDLSPGQYDVYLRSSFASQYSETRSHRVIITAGSTSTQDFVETLGTGQVTLNVSGLFSDADLSWVHTQLLRQDPSPGIETSAEHFAPIDGQFEHLLPSGLWRRYLLRFGLYDSSDPQLPLNVQYYRYRYNDSGAPPISVAPGTVENLGAEDVTLVKSNAYFSVRGSSTPLDSPYIDAYRNEFNGDGSLKYHRWFRAYGSSTQSNMPALTMVAEPGTYTMRAYATVNDSVTQLSTQDVRFGTPAPTLPSADPSHPKVLIKPIEGTALTVSLEFPQVTSPGVTTVTETPFGPEPPEGFQAFCENGDVAADVGCNPIYYDIKTTASYPDGPDDRLVKVCVKRQFLGPEPTEFLSLGHYDETTSAWEVLEPPPGADRSAMNCIDDLAACGCDDESSCGIDYSDPDNPISVVQVCGMTRSFSPFTVLKGKLKFTNTVDGVSYEGPTGPPALQSWTVQESGVYRITAVGARGASASQATNVSGGCGAQIAGDFTLSAGDNVAILVGQKGTSAPYSGGGGGGTFVTLNGSPLVIAGGGGGVRSGALVNGRNGSVSTAGVSGSVSSSYTSGFIAGGANGLGGTRIASYGSAGGGWLGNGASDGAYGEGGFAFSAGIMAGKGGVGKSCGGLAHGGYGGGGAGNGCYGGGGGGGYSGGGGGRVGGGGGSLNSGANPAGGEGVCTPSGHGVVTIEHLSQ
ncbi:endo-1,C4-beta-glucanase [Sorangium sp. So ce1153]|uniref:endo-1,C4-beta-glucanase n=1 Tax=Sorangium sp. So ce1153 TaxID=3133333 RepID=UPI003F621D1C